MRLREITAHLKELLPKLDLKFARISNSVVQFSDYRNVMDSLEEVYKYGFINEEIEELKKIGTLYNLQSIDTDVAIDDNTKNIVSSIVSRVKEKIFVVIRIAKVSVPEEVDNSIDVKLPEFKQLHDASKFFNDLDKALNTLVTVKEVEGKVELRGFESGSMWLTILLGTPSAVGLIGAVVTLIVKLRDEYFRTKELMAYTDSLKVKNDAQKLLTEALELEIKNKFQTEVHNLMDQVGIERSPEIEGKYLHSVTTLSKYIYAGAEIRPSLMAGKQEKDNFPVSTGLFANQEVKQLKELTDTGNEDIVVADNE